MIEYKIVELGRWRGVREENHKLLEDGLNKYAKDGWKVVSCIPDMSDGTTIFPWYFILERDTD